MKQILLCILFSFSSLALFGQIFISLDPNPSEVLGSANDSDLEADVTIKNNSQVESLLLWKRTVISGPSEWVSYICDRNNCYLPTASECPQNKPNLIAAGESIEFQLHIQPHETVGEGQINIEFYDLSDPNQILDTLKVFFTVSQTTSTKDFAKEDIKVYPNPTSDLFQINDPNVQTVTVFNIVGSKMRTFDAIPDRYYDVSDLKEGLYLVRMMDRNNKVIKTVRLSKR